MKVISTIVQWLIVIALIYVIVIAVPAWPRLHDYVNLPTINGLTCVLFSVSFSFWFVYILKWFKSIKPFNCLKCLTGWVALITAILFHVETPYLYLFIGLFTGALADVIINRL